LEYFDSGDFLMIADTTQFMINSPDVVSETIDGEAVIVSLARGIYYSLDQVGVDVWSLIEKGFPADKILTVITQKFDGDVELIESSIKELLSQLCAEQLVTPIAKKSDIDSTAAFPDLPSTKAPFVPPVLQKYSDMMDLLMLDPIHEVDAVEGWPAKKEGSAD
jgi:hypothetical protein